MLKVLKFLVWTTCAIGIGVFLGRTDALKDVKVDVLKDAYQSARSRLAGEPRPERYSKDEREAVDRIIAKSPTK